jgi:hypothetical protein
LLARRRQRLELLRRRTWQCAYLRADALGEEREDVRIDPIGRRELPRRPREVAHLARIHDDHWECDRGERAHAKQLVAAGGFHDDQLRRTGPDPIYERAHAALGIRTGPPVAARAGADH